MTDPLTTIRNAYAAIGSGDIPGLLALLRDDVRWRFHGIARFWGMLDREAAATARVPA